MGPNPPYDEPAVFTSGGPNDYVDPVNGTLDNVRQVVDIAAPGENLSGAYYGGETGGNGTVDNPSIDGPGPTGLPYGSLGGADTSSGDLGVVQDIGWDFGQVVSGTTNDYFLGSSLDAGAAAQSITR